MLSPSVDLIPTNEMPSAHEPVKGASRRWRGSGRPLSLTVSPLQACASRAEWKYSAVPTAGRSDSGSLTCRAVHPLRQPPVVFK
jgi:hypothetical protein